MTQNPLCGTYHHPGQFSMEIPAQFSAEIYSGPFICRISRSLAWSDADPASYLDSVSQGTRALPTARRGVVSLLAREHDDLGQDTAQNQKHLDCECPRWIVCQNLLGGSSSLEAIRYRRLPMKRNRNRNRLMKSR